MNKPLMLLALLALGLVLSGCTGQTGQGTGNSTQGTGTAAPLTAQYGDTVTVDYVLRVDGEVIDTSMMSAAKAAGTYDSTRSYQPLTFKMLLGGQVIPGFVNGILGMKAGESRNFTVAPADGYGLSDPSKITNISRYYNMSSFEEVPMGYFLANNITVKVDKVFPTAVGYVTIYNFTNDTVTIQYLLEKGDKFTQYGLPQEVVSATNDTLFLKFDMEQNNSYVATDPVTGQKKLVRVPYADNETITLDENPALAGKELDFEVKLLSISQ